jgi:hypothetical protein
MPDNLFFFGVVLVPLSGLTSKKDLQNQILSYEYHDSDLSHTVIISPFSGKCDQCILPLHEACAGYFMLNTWYEVRRALNASRKPTRPLFTITWPSITNGIVAPSIKCPLP